MSQGKNQSGAQEGYPTRLENIFLWFFFVLVLLAPYYRGLYFRFERAPFFLLICGAGIAIAIIRTYYRVPFSFPLHLALPFALFVLLYGINVFFSADHGLAHQEFVNWAVYCLFFLLVTSLRPGPSWMMLLLFGANVVVLALISIFQGFGWIPEGLYLFSMSLRALFIGGRIYSTFQYPNTASAYFAMGYLALLGVTFWEKKGELFQNLASFLAFLALAGTFFTYSRGGMLVLGLVLFIMLFVLPRKPRTRLFFGILTTAFPLFVLLPFLERFLRVPKPLPFLGILFAGGVVALALRGILSPLEELVASWPRGKFLLGVTLLLVAVGSTFLIAVHFGIVGGGATRLLDVSLRTRSVWERLIFYRDGLQIFSKRPLTGWGGGGWEALYLSIRSFPYATRVTHNLYLQLLIEGGVVGAALFLLLLFSLVRGTAKALGSDETPWMAVLFGSLLLSFLHGFVDFNFSLGAYQLGVWFFAGCAVSFFLGKAISPEVSRPLRLHPLAIGLVSLFLFTLAYSLVMAEWRYTIGRYFVEGDELKIRILEEATRLEPWNPEIYYYLSKTLRKKANIERNKAIHTKAIEMGERAVRLAPYNSLFLEHLGILYAERGEFHKALPFIERAIAADPLRLNPYPNLARICRAAAIRSLEKGEREGALFFLEKGIQTGELLEKARERSLEPPEWDPAEVQEVETLVGEMEELKEKLLQLQG